MSQSPDERREAPLTARKARNKATAATLACDQCGWTTIPDGRSHKRAENDLDAHKRLNHRSYVEPLPAAGRGRGRPTERVRRVVSGGLPGHGRRG